MYLDCREQVSWLKLKGSVSAWLTADRFCSPKVCATAVLRCPTLHCRTSPLSGDRTVLPFAATNQGRAVRAAAAAPAPSGALQTAAGCVPARAWDAGVLGGAWLA